MALRSLARKIVPVAAAATPRLAPPSRSLHHVEDKLLRRVGVRCYRIGKNAGTDAESVKRVSEPSSFNKMLIGGASVYAVLLFFVTALRDNAREELRRTEEKYGL